MGQFSAQTNINDITDILLDQIVSIDDLNDALFLFQNSVGIDSADVAGHVFSGRGWDLEWKKAFFIRRKEMMVHYIDVERSYAV